MGDSFFGFTRYNSTATVGLVPAVLASIEAWKAYDGNRRVTLLHSRPDIMTYEAAGIGRDREARRIFTKLCGETAGDLDELARGVDVGASVADLLASRYSMRSPW